LSKQLSVKAMDDVASSLFIVAVQRDKTELTLNKNYLLSVLPG
jgi:hypothetical protein